MLSRVVEDALLEANASCDVGLKFLAFLLFDDAFGWLHDIDY